MMNTLKISLLMGLVSLCILGIGARTNPKINLFFRNLLGPKHGLRKFLRIINSKGTLLDVGCGPNSPFRIKSNYPQILYTGIDIVEHVPSESNQADNFIVSTPENFATDISKLGNTFDTVISSHNLEHCNDREGTLDAMVKVLKPNGYIFITFPSQKSVSFPSRKGTLNYYDDGTHRDLPPDFNAVIAFLKENQINILASHDSYKPTIPFLLGFFFEPISRWINKTTYNTWSYYGFESIIWGQKKI